MLTRALVHLLLLLIAPPFFLGVINRVKSFFSGRTGPPLLQLYYDIARLMGKGFAVSRTTTWIFWAAPVISLAAVFSAGLLVPFGEESPVSFTGDAILFAYLFGLSRFLTTSSALDTGSAFEGMGAAREVTFACFAEPVLFLILIALTHMTGSLSLGDMLGASLSAVWAVKGPPLLLISVGLFVLVLAENCRIPFDDPNTHLELTMIHEVMVLDHSGPLLGFVLYGAAMKLFVLGAVLVRLVAPVETGNALLDAAILLVGNVLLAGMIGVVESTMARLKLLKVPSLLVAAGILCAFGFLLLLR